MLAEDVPEPPRLTNGSGHAMSMLNWDIAPLLPFFLCFFGCLIPFLYAFIQCLIVVRYRRWWRFRVVYNS